MLEYNKGQEEKVLRAIITKLKPSTATLMMPGLPAYVLCMLICYLDHIQEYEHIKPFMQGALRQIIIAGIKTKQNVEMKALWLKNSLQLLHCMMQFILHKLFNILSVDPISHYFVRVQVK